jgi:hypothetical protein
MGKRTVKSMMSRVAFGAALIVGLICLFGVYYFAFIHFLFQDPRLERVEAHLLLDTNYQTLLDACRDLSRRADELGLKREHEYKVHLEQGESLEPAAANLPAIIRDLDPVWVRLTEDSVWIILAGGLAHAGVVAYLPEHMNGPFVEFLPAEKKRELVPGLWFYDEAYHGNSRDTKRIDALIQEGMKRQPPGQGTPKD